MARLRRRDALRLGALGWLVSAAAEPDPPSSLSPRASRRFTLAFGSCNKPALPQPLWAPIRALSPDAWLWLGDNVYADTNDIAHTRQLYAAQKNVAEYAALAASTRVIGTWDDHDYGQNDAGSEYPQRVESQAALLDFLNEASNSPRRTQAGVYASYVFGSGAESVKVILLDGRYHRQRPGPLADTLGAAQWSWLERELAQTTARVTLIGSGYQIVPVDHPFEKWANFPAARQRLLELVRKSRLPNVVFLSGDRHFAELSRLPERRMGQAVYELTSSGLTHSYERANERNRYRVGELYALRNFGVVRVDWDAAELSLEARGEGGQLVIDERVPLSAARLATPHALPGAGR